MQREGARPLLFASVDRTVIRANAEQVGAIDPIPLSSIYLLCWLLFSILLSLGARTQSLKWMVTLSSDCCFRTLLLQGIDFRLNSLYFGI